VLTTNQKGAIAETAILHEATKQGIVVYRPAVEGARADMIFECGARLLRIQCKWARLVGEVVEVRARTCRRGPGGTYVRGTYSADEVDAIAAYCMANDTAYLLPFAMFAQQTALYLRLSEARNNQQRLVHWAEHYRLGAIAQLGERDTGSVEVVGSSPTSSIAKPPSGAALF
jgi:PD-(D/E)XK nuclease superfamily protein